MDNKLVGNSLRALTQSNSSPTPTLQAIFLGLTLSLILDPTLALGRYIDKNLQKTIKVALKSFFQGQQH